MPPKRKTAKKVVRQYEVTAMGLSRLVTLAKMRESPKLLSELMRMNLAQIVEHVKTLGPARLTEDEAETLEARMDAIAEISSRELTEIKLALSSNNISAQGATSKEKLAMILLAEGDPPVRSIALDAFQEGAVQTAMKQRFQIVYAGPGAGKTTTLCGLAVRAAEAGMRVAVLAYNRNARKVMLTRLPAFRHTATILSAEKARAGEAQGVGVLTFDQYVYHFRVRRALDAAFQGNADARPLPGAWGGVALKPGNTNSPAHGKAASEVRAALAGGYAKSFQFGVSQPLGPNERWDLLIVDEAQDVKPEHEKLITQIMRVSPHVVAAGDARQEMYSGATWFSRMIAQARNNVEGAPHMVELTYNHRSTPQMIAAINACSRLLFPTLHYDQRPPGAEDGWDAEFTPENGFGGALRWVIGGAHMGDEVAACLRRHAPSETIAVTPMSVEKWGNGAVIASVMQNVYDSGSDRMVLVLGKGSVLDDYAYFVGTARTAKGTERDHVVLFAPDKQYQPVIPHASLCKSLFVCVSRARKSLTIVLAGPVREDFPLAPLVPKDLRTTEARPPPRAIPLTVHESVLTLARMEFWDNGAAGDVIEAAMREVRPADGIEPVEVTIDERYANDEEARGQMPDAEIAGLVVEAGVAVHMGFNLSNIVAVRPARIAADGHSLEESVGVRTARLDEGGPTVACAFEVVYHPLKVRAEGVEMGAKTRGRDARETSRRAFEAQLWSFIRENAAENPAYAHVVLGVSAVIGRLWTMSERLRSLDLLAQCQPWASHVEEYVRARDVGAEGAEDANLQYQLSGSVKVRAHRSDVVVGSILYAMDFFANVPGTGKRVLELKHVKALEREHAAQASMYATIAHGERKDPKDDERAALLVNTRDSTCTLVRGLPARALSDRVRALYALQVGRMARNHRDTHGLTRHLPHLTRAFVGLPVIVVDIETGRRSLSDPALITEVGAVCFTFTTQNMLIDTFHRLGSGVREVSEELEFRIARGTASPDDASAEDAEGVAEGVEGDDEAEDEDRGRGVGGTGAGTPDDPWVPFAPAGLGVTSIPALTADQPRMCAEFRKWVQKCAPGGALIVQWAGADAQMLGACDLPDVTVVNAHHAYKWYLESTGSRRTNATTLEHAVFHLLGPGTPFAPHRAFDDAVMTAAVLVAMQSEGGVV